MVTKVNQPNESEQAVFEKDIAETLIDSGISEPGFDTSALTLDEQRMPDDQQKFLAGYATGGTIKAGLRASNVHRRTVERWRESDALGFQGRYTEAKQLFCDSLEDIALDLVMQLNPGQTPVLLITLLNANLPEKYRPNVVVADNDAAKRTLDALAQAAKNTKKAAEENSELTPLEQVTDFLRQSPS